MTGRFLANLGSCFLASWLLGTRALKLNVSLDHDTDSNKRMGKPTSQLWSRLEEAQDALAKKGRSPWDVYEALQKAASSAMRQELGSIALHKTKNLPTTGMSSAENTKLANSLLDREITMLSESQKALLDRIGKGAVTKADIEIVVAHYDEDISWISMYEPLATYYCKGDIFAVYPKRPAGCNTMPSLGLEAHTFLNHIVRNYDRLADWTVFTEAQAPTYGWSSVEGDNNNRNGHIYPGASFHDYVLGGGPFEGGDRHGARFIFNGMWKPPAIGTPGWEMVHMAFAPFGRGRYYSDGQAGSRLNASCLEFSGSQVDLDLGGPEVALALVAFIEMIGAGRDTKYYSQGGRFALSRERIRQRPREFYEQLLNFWNFVPDPGAPGPVNHVNRYTKLTNVFLELLWYYIPGKPNQEAPCKQEGL